MVGLIENGHIPDYEDDKTVIDMKRYVLIRSDKLTA